MLHSLKPREFEAHVRDMVVKRRAEVEKKGNLLVKMRPEFAARLKETELLDRVSAILS